MSRAARRLLAAALAAVLGLGAMELGLRAFDLVRPAAPAYPGERAPRPSATFAADPAVGWRMRPDATFHWIIEGRDVEYRADAEGFRRGGPAPAPGDRCVVVAGDSFAFGAGVGADETFAARLDGLLPGVTVKNVAQPGYGVDQICAAARQALDAWRPAAVVAALYPEDFERSRTAFREKEGFAKPLFDLRGGELVEVGAGEVPGALRLWLERRCRVYAAFEELERRAGERFAIGERWRVNGPLLRALAERCRTQGAALLLVHVPPRTWRPFPALRRFATTHDIALLDPVELAPSAPAEAYFPVDSHLAPAGHRQFADWIAAALAPLLPP